MEEKKKVLTTSTGRRIDSNQNSLTAGERGPILLSDFYLLEKMSSFDHERAPERVVHAKGAGAHGYFEVTHDISKYCKAKIFNKIGKRTPAFVRFSTVIGERGSADTWRDPRGFAIKFYTEEGNWDLVCNNTPVFFVRDPLKFFDFIHSQKRNPQTNLKDHDAYWDFLSLTPESIHQITYMFGGRGTPDGYRHMNGYGSHTFKMVNSNHEVFYVKFHVKSDAGIHNLKWPVASKLAEDNPDYSTQDLYEHIAKGNEASWTFYIQVMPFAEGESYKWDIFDVTKVWPHSDYPLIPVGKLVLNRNPLNYFQEVEQSAFNPASMVEGIEPSNDKMLQARLFAYQDTQRHRIGPNFTQIPINCPYATKVATLNRDGPMRYDGNHGNEPSYEPNSIEGAPREAANAKMQEYEITGKVGRFGFNHPNDDFEQASTLFRKVMDDGEREDLINNLVTHMKMVTKKEILERQCEIFYRCDPEYGTRVAQGLGITPHGSKTE